MRIHPTHSAPVSKNLTTKHTPQTVLALDKTTTTKSLNTSYIPIAANNSTNASFSTDSNRNITRELPSRLNSYGHFDIQEMIHSTKATGQSLYLDLELCSYQLVTVNT